MQYQYIQIQSKKGQERWATKNIPVSLIDFCNSIFKKHTKTYWDNWEIIV